MEKRVSSAFVLMCFATLLSLIEIISIVLATIGLFKNFQLIRAANVLCVGISTLTPVAIAVLLYFNRKKDIKLQAYIVLMICGFAKLMVLILNISVLSRQFYLLTISPLEVLLPLVSNITLAVLGFLLIAVAISIKKGKTSGTVKGLAFVTIWTGILLLICKILPYTSGLGGLGLLPALNLVVLAAGLQCLPKTICDYDNGSFFNKNTFKLVGVIVAVIIFVMFVATAVVNDSSSRGNCFYCGGDGRVDGSSCIWCGGDGNAVWNP